MTVLCVYKFHTDSTSLKKLQILKWAGANFSSTSEFLPKVTVAQKLIHSGISIYIR